MKSAKSNILFLFVISLFLFTNCEKSPENSMETSNLITDGFTLAPASLQELIATPETPDLQALNLMLLNQAKDISIYMQNPMYRIEIERLLSRKDRNGLSLSEVKSNLKSSFSVEFLENQYYPGLFLYNKSYCNMDLQPVIAVGTEIVTDDDRYSNDHIPGIYVGDGWTSELIISETMADSMKNPLYIVSEITAEFNPIESQKALNMCTNNNKRRTYEKKSASNVMYEDMDIRFAAMDVNYRYESDKKSEIYLIWYYIENDYIHDFQHEHYLFQIHKNDIPGLFASSHSLPHWIGASIYPIRDDYDYYLNAVSYEQDWFVVDRKEVVVQYGAPPLKCQMRFSNEYYQRVSLYFTGSTWSIYSNKIITDKGNIYFTRYPNH